MGFLKELGTGLLNAVTGGLAGAVGSLFGLGPEAASNAMTKADQKELMKYQYDLNMQGVENQRAYDSPEAQMKRLESAGLNPHLVYGSGSVVGNTSSTPSASLSQARKTELGRYQEMAVNQSLAQAQTEIENNKKYGILLDTKADETRQAISESKAREQNLLSDTENKKNANTWFWNTYEIKNEILQNQLALIKGQTEVAKESAKRLVFMTNKQGEYIDAQINSIGETIAQRWKQIGLESKRLAGQLRLWAQTGDAAQRNSKALLIQAMTGRRLADIKEDQWNQLGPLMVDKMRMQNFGQWLKNKWTEVSNQWKMDHGTIDEVKTNSQIDLNWLKFDDMMRDSFNDFLDFGFDFEF